ncbi:MAG: flavin reductase family protein [Candidatus Melainabacteria bacterium]|nr:flavin reductase family protein [Candidatus Melainabacteria bacterium]
MNKISINTKEIPFQDRYKLLIGSIVPRPIGFISTISKDGIYNLAPFSFFNGVCSEPMTVLFCPVIRGSDGQEKDTLKNIKAIKEFVVNIVSEEFAEKMNQCSAEYPPDVDEFKESGLTPEKSKVVKPPLVKEAKVNMECKLIQLVEIGNKPGGGTVVIGEVVYFHAREDVYQDGKIILSKLKPIGRLGGTEYCRVTDNFSLPRPQIKAQMPVGENPK